MTDSKQRFLTEDKTGVIENGKNGTKAPPSQRGEVGGGALWRLHRALKTLSLSDISCAKQSHDIHTHKGWISKRQTEQPVQAASQSCVGTLTGDGTITAIIVKRSQ